MMSFSYGAVRTYTLRLDKPLFYRSSLSLHRRTRQRLLYATRSCTSVASLSAADKREKVIVISGPTGAGKSRLALELAKRLNGEIVSADSVQVYHGLDVGSAKPSLSERKEVPHHLIDILHPSEEYSAGRFFDDARQATKDILTRGNVPIVTGGTGLYLRWFMYGKPDVPKASSEITAEVYSDLATLQTNEDWDAAVQLVVNAGNPKAQSIAINDWYRLRRSLEIIKSSGLPPSAYEVPYESFKQQAHSSLDDCPQDINYSGDGVDDHKSKHLEYDFMCFFLSSHRIDLYRMIDYRCEDMLSGTDGLLSEAKWLLDTGLLPNSNPATRAIGYRQAMEYILRCREQEGYSSSRDFSVFLSEFQKASRNFAKRQLTWFRNEHIYNWLDASKPMEDVINFICNAYHDQSGNLIVPSSLRMKKDMDNHREIRQLKGYRPKNRLFLSRDDCSGVLDWIRLTQGQTSEFVCQ
ncbi:tRNA dimethylallyltransferase 9 [Impatiens glandulifera]|uniref:tRNA dimethylallyltransferase 9 n=1 Tax=Impatiens glandulifera TaxID=253017 RepID=UPI001FB144E5|nr:tRNA dimethylallyltransferase 9 [Impatiens glandulifera]